MTKCRSIDAMRMRDRRLPPAVRRDHPPQPECADRARAAAGRDRGAAGATSGPLGGDRRGLCRFRRRERHAAGRLAIRICWSCRRCPSRVRWPGCGSAIAIGDADADRGAGAGEGQLQFLSARPARPGRRHRRRCEDEAWFEQSRARVIAGRARLNRGLARAGFRRAAVAANFVFARHPKHEGAALTAALRERA